MIEITNGWFGWLFMGILTIPVVLMWVCHFWPKLVCKMFGHKYPLVSMHSTLMATLADPDKANKDFARMSATCERCGKMDEAEYQRLTGMTDLLEDVDHRQF